MIDCHVDAETEDLQIDNHGIVLYFQDGEAAINAVIRRAATPRAGYARTVRVGDETIILNNDYYTDLPYYLSSTDLNMDDINSAMSDAANADGRVTVVETTLTRTGINSYAADVRYLYNESDNVLSTTL